MPDRRTQRFTIRVTPAEAAAIRAHAHHAHWSSPSALIRNATLQALTRRKET